MLPNSIEDIYPLTIISMRYGGKIIIFEAECDCEQIVDLQCNEELFYCFNTYLEENVVFNFGVGDTISEAFIDYKNRMLKNLN